MSLKWKDRSASIQLNNHLSSPSSVPSSEPATRDTKGTYSGTPWKVCSLVESCIPTKILDMGLEYTPREMGQQLVFSSYRSLKLWGLARLTEAGAWTRAVSRLHASPDTVLREWRGSSSLSLICNSESFSLCFVLGQTDTLFGSPHIGRSRSVAARAALSNSGAEAKAFLFQLSLLVILMLKLENYQNQFLQEEGGVWYHGRTSPLILSFCDPRDRPCSVFW